MLAYFAGRRDYFFMIVRAKDSAIVPKFDPPPTHRMKLHM